MSAFQEDPILVWREDVPSDFDFEPILVDNNFFYRVDEAYRIGT